MLSVRCIADAARAVLGRERLVDEGVGGFRSRDFSSTLSFPSESFFPFWSVLSLAFGLRFSWLARASAVVSLPFLVSRTMVSCWLPSAPRLTAISVRSSSVIVPLVLLMTALTVSL